MGEAQGLPISGWGPEACRAAVSVTFDNLGEAADLERGSGHKAGRSDTTTR